MIRESYKQHIKWKEGILPTIKYIQADQMNELHYKWVAYYLQKFSEGVS